MAGHAQKEFLGGDDTPKKVTFEENVRSPKPQKPRRRSLNQLMMTNKQNSGKLDVKKHHLETSSSRQRVPTIKLSATSTDDKKPNQSKGDVLNKQQAAEDKSKQNLKKFEKVRKTAKALAISDFMRNPHVMSERKAQNLMMEQHAFQRPLDQDSHLDLANQQKPGMARIDRPRKKVGLLGDDNKLITNVRRSSISLYSTPQVMEVLSKIQDSKTDRKKDGIRNELKVILDRVKMNLFDVGIEFDEEDMEDEARQQRQKTILGAFDTRSERERMHERNYIAQKLEDFEVKAVTRKGYLTELMLWFEDNMNISGDCLSPEELSQMVREAIEMHRVISNCLNSFERTGDKIVELGKALLEETGKIIKEKKDMLSKKTKKERIIVYDDKMLQGDPIKWDVAVKTIMSVFEDAFKMIKNINYKNALMLGKKQFEYMMVASDKRYKELDEKKKQCHELQGKLHGAKMANDKLVREMEEQKRKMMKATSELSETKHSLEKMKEKNKEMNFKIVELNEKIKFLEQEINRILTRTPTPPPTPPPPPEPEQVIVKVVDSVTEMRLQECEEALEEANVKIEELFAKIAQMEDQIQSEQSLNKDLQSKITELESIEIPERQPTPPPPVIEAPPPPPEPTQDKDANYFKTLMAGMKNEFGAELEKMKAHMKKEKTRNEANVRRLEHQQKEQLQSIQKDTIRMLRAIMHFRDQMIHVLEKENLGDPAQALHDLGSLIKDKLSPDPREVLAQVVVTVVDYLHKVEGILSNSFLAMKIMMKHQVEKQVEAELEVKKAKEKKDEENKKVAKDIKKRKTVLNDAKDDVQKMAKKLKKAKNKLKRAQADIEEAGAGDQRYKDLMARYKQVWRLYKNMQKEMEMLQNDFNRTMQQKLEEKETMIVTRLNMEMKQRRAINEEQLKISIIDQRQNLRLLYKAYEDNKISKELYTMASALIEKTLEIPRRKLQHLFEQYIAFRTVKESKERVADVLQDEELAIDDEELVIDVQKDMEAYLCQTWPRGYKTFRDQSQTQERVAFVLKDEELAIDVRKDMESYIEQIDKKFGQSMTKWRIHLVEIENEKNTLNKKIYSLFNEVLVETGLLLIHPLLKDSNKSRAIIRAATTINRDKMKMMLQRRGRGLSIMMKLPTEGIKGSNCITGQTPDSMWYPHQILPAEPSPRVTEPHMLAYEVNRKRLMSFRHIKGRVREYPVFKAESFNIAERNGVQFIREIPFYIQKRPPIVCPR